MTISFRIGDWLVEPDQNRLVRGEHQVRIDPKVMQVLLFLAEHPGQVALKENIIETVWEDTFVTDEVLTNAVWELRKALGDDAKAPQFIQTVPRKGYRLIAVVRSLSEEPAVAEQASKMASGVRAAPAVAPSRRWVPWVGGAAVAASFVTAGLYVHLSREVPGPPLRTIPLTSDPGPEWDPVLSPDGGQVVYGRRGESGQPELYVKLIDGGEPLRIAHGYTPTWSPDGRRIAFIRHIEADAGAPFDGVFVISALGGAERRLGVFRGEYVSSYSGHGLSWSPNGKLLAIPRRETPDSPISIYLLSVETGETQRLTAPPLHTMVGDHDPRFSPDGETLAFVRVRAVSENDIYLVPVGGGEPHRLTFRNHAIAGLDWTPDGRSIVFSSSQPGRGGVFSLWRIPVSGGEPEPLEGGEGGDTPTLSREGERLAYVKDTSKWDIWRVGGPSAREEEKIPVRFISSTWNEWEPQYSPDGQKILFTSHRSGYNEIWACDGDGSNPRQLTFLEDFLTHLGSWSPDGRQIAFTSAKEGSRDVYLVSSSGGFPRRLTTESWNELPVSWSRDGRWIYFSSDRTGRQEVWKMPAEGGEAIQLTKNGGVVAFESPDGRFLYFGKRNPVQGPRGIWRIPVDGGEEVKVLEHAGLSDWAVTREGIFYVNYDTDPGPSIELFEFAGGRVGQVTVLEHSPGLGFSVSPDGRWILYMVIEPESDIMLVENFR